MLNDRIIFPQILEEDRSTVSNIWTQGACPIFSFLEDHILAHLYSCLFLSIYIETFTFIFCQIQKCLCKCEPLFANKYNITFSQKQKIIFLWLISKSCWLPSVNVLIAFFSNLFSYLGLGGITHILLDVTLSCV